MENPRRINTSIPKKNEFSNLTNHSPLFVRFYATNGVGETFLSKHLSLHITENQIILYFILVFLLCYTFFHFTQISTDLYIDKMYFSIILAASLSQMASFLLFLPFGIPF